MNTMLSQNDYIIYIITKYGVYTKKSLFQSRSLQERINQSTITECINLMIYLFAFYQYTGDHNNNWHDAFLSNLI